MTTAASDFLALGTVRWMLRDLTIAMGHSDALDHESLTRELLAGAHAWRIGDWASAVNRLRAGLRGPDPGPRAVLPRRRLSDRSLPARPGDARGVLADPLESPVAISFMAPAQAIENQALHDPQRVAALRQAISRRLGRRRGRHLLRGRRSALAAGVDPLAVPAGQRGLSRSPRRPQRRDLRAAAVRPAHPAAADRQAVWISLSRFTWASTPGGSRFPPRPSGCGRAPTAAASKA